MGLFNWLCEIENCMEMLFEGLFPGLTSSKRLTRSTIPSGIVITKFIDTWGYVVLSLERPQCVYNLVRRHVHELTLEVDGVAFLETAPTRR